MFDPIWWNGNIDDLVNFRLMEWKQTITLYLTVKTDMYSFNSSVNVRPLWWNGNVDDPSTCNCENGSVSIQQFRDCSTPLMQWVYIDDHWRYRSVKCANACVLFQKALNVPELAVFARTGKQANRQTVVWLTCIKQHGTCPKILVRSVSDFWGIPLVFLQNTHNTKSFLDSWHSRWPELKCSVKS